MTKKKENIDINKRYLSKCHPWHVMLRLAWNQGRSETLDKVKVDG